MKTNEFIDLIDNHVQQLNSMLPRLLKIKRLKMALIMVVATIIAMFTPFNILLMAMLKIFTLGTYKENLYAKS